MPQVIRKTGYSALIERKPDANGRMRQTTIASLHAFSCVADALAGLPDEIGDAAREIADGSGWWASGVKRELARMRRDLATLRAHVATNGLPRIERLDLGDAEADRIEAECRAIVNQNTDTAGDVPAST